MTARARNTDPGTSHEAAYAIDPYVTPLQRVVEEYALTKPEGFTDAEMCEDRGDTTSTLRTRRAELTARNIILDSGRTTKHGSERERILWVHRDFVPNPPPIVERESPINEAALKAEGRLKAAKLNGFANSLYREGREMLADELRVCARVMERLAK